MPPKKKADKGKKKKGKKKDAGNDELNIEEMYKRTAQEVDCLKERLAERQVYARRSRAAEEHMREKMLEAKDMMQEEMTNKREITFDLTRQYKTMQAQLESKIEHLEAQVKRLETNLEETTKELQRVTEERDYIKAERDQEVESLHNKLLTMEKLFESIFQEAFDALAMKMERARQRWDAQSREMERMALDVLQEFGRDLRSAELRQDLKSSRPVSLTTPSNKSS